MPDRRRLLDSVCGTCKRVLRRADLAGEDDDSVIQLKAESMADGLIPFDYHSESAAPIAGAHANNCPKRPQ